MNKWFAVLAMTTMLGGCAHAPVEKAKDPSERLSAAYVNETIVKGKTTEKEVMQKIGPPNGVEMRDATKKDGPAKTWHFWTAPGVQTLQRGRYALKRMWVSFDDKGVVIDYNLADSAMEIP